MGLFDGMNNPWAPGGQMSPRMPWAKPALSYGWGHGNAFFTPKTQEQIRKEALLQLAVLTAVVVAPALLGAAGGAGAAGAEAAGMGASAEAAGAVAGQGAVAAGGGAALGSGLAASVGAGAGMAAILQPFLQQGSLQALQRAAQMGEGELNKELKKRSQDCNCPPKPKFATEDWLQRYGDCECSEGVEVNERPEDQYHPAMHLLGQLTDEIGKNNSLQSALRSMRQNSFQPSQSNAFNKLREVVSQQLGAFQNSWAQSVAPKHKDSREGDKKPLDIVLVPTGWQSDATGVYQNIVADARKQKGWTLRIVDDINDAASYLKGKEIRNLLIVSHGGGIEANFDIGSTVITNTWIDRLSALSGVRVQNVIVFACMAGNASTGTRILDVGDGMVSNFAYGGDTLMAGISSQLRCNAFGNWGWSYESKGEYKLSLFNNPEDIFWVTSGLPANQTYTRPTDGQYSPSWRTDIQWEGAGKWTKASPDGNITIVNRALYFMSDGTFAFTDYDWRFHANIVPIINYRMNNLGSLPSDSNLINGYGAWEAAPDVQRLFSNTPLR